MYRPPFSPVMMFKIVVIRAASDLSKDHTETSIDDRLSFTRFFRSGLSDRTPDACTIWPSREEFAKTGVIRKLFIRFDAAL